MKYCPDNHENPDEARFCRSCGYNFDVRDQRPFHMKHPEYNLRPFSEFKELSFFMKEPDYVEIPSESKVPNYYWIVKNEKFGILFWHHKHHWYGNTNDYNRIIQCKYDRIEKLDGIFACYNGDDIIYIDKNGKRLK